MNLAMYRKLSLQWAEIKKITEDEAFVVVMSAVASFEEMAKEWSREPWRAKEVPNHD